MKATETIAKLQQLVNDFGDLDVTDEMGAPIDLVYYMYEAEEPITPSPVFAFSVAI